MNDFLHEFSSSGRTNELVLADRHYDRRVFRDLTIALPPKSTLIHDVTFNRCRVDPGACRFSGDVTLRNVVFDSFDCGDTLYVGAQVTLDRVVIRGVRKPGRVEIRPITGETGRASQAGVEWALDLSEYGGTVLVYGIPRQLIRRGPTQVAVDLGGLRGRSWADLGIGRTSYWGLTGWLMDSIGVRHAVVNLPARRSKHYELDMEQLKRLGGEGICFW